MKIGKKMKKAVAIALSAVMVMAMGSIAFGATTATGTSSDTGSVTVSGLEDGVTASAYQIAKATYDASGNFTGYQMTVTGGDWSIANDGTYTEPSESDLAALWSQVSSSTATGSATAEGGTATISGLPVGSYLIVITGSESTVYSMMIGSVSYTTQEGTWATDSGSINAVSDGNVWVKAATPTIDKEEVGANNEDTHGESVNIGDELTFHITVKNIPHYDGEYPEFEVDDVLTGLTITDAELASLTVKVGDTTLTSGTDYVVTKVSDTEFTVDFVVNGAYTLNDYAGESLVIEYTATVSELAADESGVADHNNNATLTFSTNSYVDGSENDPDGENPDDDTSHAYTFSASLTKVGSDDEHSDALSGASFALYQGESTEAVATATSDNDGIFTFSDLKEGTYTMKETSAPDGYVLDTTEYTVVIAAEYNDADGTIQSWTITVKNGDTTVGTASGTAKTNATITNVAISSGGLPNMGGRGTLIITLIGCAVVACACAGVAVSRRRKAA